MRTIYVDSDYKCHIADDGMMRIVETDFFDGKCDAFLEGYCYDTSKGYVQIYPWKPYDELDEAQRTYEKQQLEEYKDIVAEQDLMILDMQYNALFNDL